MIADEVCGLAQKTGSAKAGVINPVACLGLHDLDHGTDDVALGVELARISGRIGRDALEQVFVNLREHDAHLCRLEKCSLSTCCTTLAKETPRRQ